jgi:hypothetical protein
MRARIQRSGIVTGFLLLGGIFALMLTRQTDGQVGKGTPPTPPPTVSAFFSKDNQLQVVVKTETAGKMQVVLIDKDQTLGKSEVDVKDGNSRIEFELAKAKADTARIKVSFKDSNFEVALSKILLLKAHEMTLLTGEEFYTGTQSPIACTVQSVRTLTENVAIPAADVTVRLKDKDGKYHYVAGGTTNNDGRADLQMRMPNLEPGQYTLEVASKSVMGEEKLERAVKLKSGAKILLTTDKPIYQPGHMMHIRTLVLRPVDQKPVANKEMQFEVEDPKGNKVFKKTLTTSEFGIASVDFQLADEVNMGDYHLRAAIGDTRADSTVTVKRYVLPKFKVDVKADKTFYLPKEKVQVELQSDYTFGKPVNKAKIEVTASTFDIQFREFHKWTGTTDDNGHAKFDIQLPDYFVGQPLAKGNGLVKLEVSVVDTADHRQVATRTYPVCEQAIQISLIPEGGKLVPGLENRIFAAAVYPDGSPVANCEVNLWFGKDALTPPPSPQGRGDGGERKAKERGAPQKSAKTNSAGLAEFRLVAKNEEFSRTNDGVQDIEMLGGKRQIWGQHHVLDVRAEARDPRGNQAHTVTTLNSQPMGENVLLRLDKAIYQTGDSMKIDVHTSAGLPTVYIDVIRGGQVMLSKWYSVKDGQVSQNIDLPQNVFGSLEIHAYQMLAHGEIIRDSRVVYVQSRDELKIEVVQDKGEYLPGANGRLTFKVTDAKGNPTAAALGIIIVDEAVYALQEMQPGLEKVYFTLQEELLKPKVDFKFSPGEGIDNIIMQRVIPAPRQQVAEVLLTAVKLPVPARWEVNPGIHRRQQVQGQIQHIGAGLFNYASLRAETIVTLDKTTNQWTFRPGLLDDTVKANFLPPNVIDSPFGGKFSIDDLVRLEKNFTPNSLAEAVTSQRIQQLASSVVYYSNLHKDRFFKNDRWELPESILEEIVAKQRYEARNLKDGWGEKLQLVKRDKKADQPQFGPQFAEYEIVSTGPDRKVGTADDVNFARIQKQQNLHWMANVWFMDENERLAQAIPMNGIGRGGRMREMENLRDEARAFGGPGGPGGFGGGKAGGMPLPPMAAAPDMRRDGMEMAKKDAKGEGKASDPSSSAGNSGGTAPIARVRDYFPETMLWHPALITDDKGVANLGVNFADSITTWRLSASANSTAGALGGASFPLKVFQDFFVDIDLPLNLTQNDEVTFPVAVYNYLKGAQTVRIELQQEPWFELLDGDGLVRTLVVQPNEPTAVKFRIKANKIGMQPLLIKANGTKMSDAVRRSVEVAPNGQKFEKAITDRLAGKVSQTLEIPENALPDASKIMVRIYPGVMSQVVEGLDGMLRIPNGCFEQTSSSAYPNILIIDYLRKNKISSPKLMMEAEKLLQLGYQRLLTFERPGGGFDWWGRDPALVWLSAYGLQEFSDMSKVYPIDRGIIERTQKFLLDRMEPEGTWSNIGATHGETIASMGNAKMLLTSYVTWSLLDSGLEKTRAKKSVDWIRDNVKTVENNAYILALAANALAAYDAKDDSTLEVLQKLEKLHKDMPEWKAIAFPANTTSMTYARGDFVTVESTALTALAMVRTGQFTNQVNKSMTYLIKAKHANGTWGTTSATILSLKALLAGMAGSDVKGSTPFTILVDGKEAFRGTVDEKNSDLMQSFDLKAFTKTGKNHVEIQVAGETSLMYQMAVRHYEPWKKEVVAAKPVIDVDVAYDRTKLSTNDMLKAKATLKYNGPTPTFNVIVDLGVPPGFDVDAGDFAEMVGKSIKKFSVTSRQVILYIGDVKPGDVLTFEYTLKPKYPVRARTPSSVAYEYYTPSNRAESRPVDLVVEEAKK